MRHISSAFISFLWLGQTTLDRVAASQISSGAVSTACLDIINGGSTAGTGVQIWSCNNNPQQDWTYTGGTLQSLGMCLEVVAATAKNGALLEIGTCTQGNTNQQWTRSGSTWAWQNTYCLDLANGNGANGALPQIWNCYAGNTNQAWNYAGSSTSSSSTAQLSSRPSVSTSSLAFSTFPTTMTTITSKSPVPSPSATSNTGAGGSSSSTKSLSTSSVVSSSSITSSIPTSQSSTKTVMTSFVGTSTTRSSSAAAGTPVVASIAPGLCIDTAGQSTTNGAAIILSTCSGASTQAWTYASGSVSILGGTKCLDVPSGSTNPGTMPQLWDCFPGNSNQQWTRIGNVLNFAGSLCVDIPNGNAVSGQLLQIYTCATSNANQQFLWGTSTATVTGTPSMQAIRLIGRSYPGKAKLSAPQTFSWAAAGATAQFTGSKTVSVSLAMTGYPSFSVLINGVLKQSILSAADVQTITGLDPSQTYTVKLVKLNEGYYGTAVFSGFSIDLGASFLSPPSAPTRRIEVIGDSITNGYGDLGTTGNCAAGPQNEDATVSYGAVAAQYFNAEVSVIAAEGWGVYSDYLGNTANALPKVYGDAIWDDSTKPWDFTSWIPDVIVINLGTNDFYQISGSGGVANFINAYNSFISTIRSHYPSAWILLTLNPVLQGDSAVLMNGLIQSVISYKVSLGDKKIKYFNLTTPAYDPLNNIGEGCQQHPNVASHAAMGVLLEQTISSFLSW